MKDLGRVNKSLWMNIKQSNGEISLSLEDYITKKASELNYDLYDTYNPLQPNVDYYGDSPQLKNITRYQSSIGTLLIVANTGRRGMTHSESFPSRYLKDTRVIHLKAVKGIVAYLNTYKDI